MIKALKAEKYKDGWYVEIVQSAHALTKSDVLKIVRQNGLRLFKSCCNDNKITAD